MIASLVNIFIRYASLMRCRNVIAKAITQDICRLGGWNNAQSRLSSAHSENQMSFYAANYTPNEARPRTVE